MTNLARRLVKLMPKATLWSSGEIGLRNAKENLAYIQKSIFDLPRQGSSRDVLSAIVVGAGPSLHKRQPAQQILASNFQGDIITTDGSLGYCLRNSLIPDYVVCLDPHPTRIVRWFGDSELENRELDDYFQRQDLDPTLNTDEAARNRELIELVNKYGSHMKAILSTSVSPNVARRCFEAGMDVYWWNPLYDDYRKPHSYSRQVYSLTKIPCMVPGGNSGTAAWIFAHSVLRRRYVALIGMDFSYPPNTPLYRTQYYYELLELFGDQMDKAFIRVYNPYLKETWFADPAYYWYRESFLKLARYAKCETSNCTEGGILFGKGVRFIPLSRFFKKV